MNESYAFLNGQQSDSASQILFKDFLVFPCALKELTGQCALKELTGQCALKELTGQCALKE